MKHFLNISKYLMVTLSLLTLTACGGGGGGSDTPLQEQAVVSMALTGSVDTIGSVTADIDLPEGVSLQTDADGNLADGVLSTNLPGAYVLAAYQPEAAVTVGHLQLALIDGDGFSPGEFATLLHDLAQGEVLPLAVDFTVSNLTVTDLDGTELFGCNLDITVQSQEVSP